LKITDVETFIVRQELGPEAQFCYSQAWYSDRTLLLLRVRTDEGLEGWGEAFGPAIPHKAIIDSLYAPHLIGRDPFDSSVIWNELYNKLRDHGQKGLSIEALSAVDIALWDLKGKFIGLPVYKLMGGSHRKRILPYATGMYRRKDGIEHQSIASEALSYVESGFKAVKIKIGFGYDYDVSAVQSVREAIGPGIRLMVDANHAYNASMAIRIGKAIQDFDISWFEEPVPPEDIQGYKEVRDALDIPIAGGEAEFTSYGFYRLLHERAIDIAQPDCGVTGGISEFLKIASLASIHNIQCYPHVWGSAIALMTGVHCCFILPDFPNSLNPGPALLEMDRTPNIFREELNLNHLKRDDDGWILPPTDPGLGLKVDMNLVDNHRIA